MRCKAALLFAAAALEQPWGMGDALSGQAGASNELGMAPPDDGMWSGNTGSAQSGGMVQAPQQLLQQAPQQPQQQWGAAPAFQQAPPQQDAFPAPQMFQPQEQFPTQAFTQQQYQQPQQQFSPVAEQQFAQGGQQQYFAAPAAMPAQQWASKPALLSRNPEARAPPRPARRVEYRGPAPGAVPAVSPVALQNHVLDQVQELAVKSKVHVDEVATRLQAQIDQATQQEEQQRAQAKARLAADVQSQVQQARQALSTEFQGVSRTVTQLRGDVTATQAQIREVAQHVSQIQSGGYNKVLASLEAKVQGLNTTVQQEQEKEQQMQADATQAMAEARSTVTAVKKQAAEEKEAIRQQTEAEQQKVAQLDKRVQEISEKDIADMGKVQDTVSAAVEEGSKAVWDAVLKLNAQQSQESQKVVAQVKAEATKEHEDVKKLGELISMEHKHRTAEVKELTTQNEDLEKRLDQQEQQVAALKAQMAVLLAQHDYDQGKQVALIQQHK